MALVAKEKNERLKIGAAEANKSFCKLNAALDLIEEASFITTKKDSDKLIRAYKLIARVKSHL